MKTLVHTLCAAVVIAVPIGSLAQSDGSLTRAQVQGEIARLQQAGFNPANANTSDFPTDIRTTAGSATGQSNGYGPSTTGSSQMGRPASTSGMKPVFFGAS
ncbi:membrane protein [Caballeronia calidae]|uniref:Membrane protein n=1 Tax=Caballeronia calidae TaxID=1777139 RepID=A0A158CU93_9BURK|nr:DUF4148 domain-containing protein [Caballeronia calidae]SAK85780.1 membrane protein [Caballeronia calidae]